MTSPVGLPPVATPPTATPPIATRPAMVPRGGQGDSKAAAEKFETMAISQFLKPMFETMGKADAPFGGGAAAKAFRPFMIDAIAKSVETRGGLGLAPMIKTEMQGAAAGASLKTRGKQGQ